MGEGKPDVKIVDERRATHDHYYQMWQSLNAGPDHPQYDFYRKTAQNHRAELQALVGGSDEALKYAAEQIIKKLPVKKSIIPRISWKRK